MTSDDAIADRFARCCILDGARCITGIDCHCNRTHKHFRLISFDDQCEAFGSAVDVWCFGRLVAAMADVKKRILNELNANDDGG